MHAKSLVLRLALYALVIGAVGVGSGVLFMFAPYGGKRTGGSTFNTRTDTPDKFYGRFWPGLWMGMAVAVPAMWAADARIRRHFAEHGDGDWRNR